MYNVHTDVHDPIIINSNYLRQNEPTSRFLINVDLKLQRLLKANHTLIIASSQSPSVDVTTSIPTAICN
jgi:hypothetical protein